LQWTVCFMQLQLGPPEFICKIQLLAKDIRHGNETVQYGETVPSVLGLWFLFGPTECPCLLTFPLLFSVNIHDSIYECPTSHFAANCTISQSLSVASGCRHLVEPNVGSPCCQPGGGGVWLVQIIITCGPSVFDG